MDKIKSITFFYPSTILGGAEFLFIRLAEAIAQEFNFKIYYVDFQEGFARKNLKNNSKISFIDFFRFKKYDIPADTVVVAPLSSIIDLLKFTRCQGNFKILFWSIHPFGLKNVMTHYLKGKRNMEIFKMDLTQFIASNGVTFMDGPNYFVQKNIFKFDGSSRYLPIPIIISEKRDVHELGGEIRITWLGRLSEEKIFPLLNMLKHADTFASKTSKFVNVNIIGEGQAGNLLISENYPNLNIVRHGSLTSTSLHNVLNKDTDVIFAMGTSALEGGAFGIPTVLVDMSYVEIPDSNRFKWLYETKDFSLAEEYTDIQRTDGYAFETLMDDVMMQYDFYAKSCYEYVSTYHSMQGVSSALVEAMSNTKLTIDMLRTSNFAEFGKLNLLSVGKSYINYLCKKF